MINIPTFKVTKEQFDTFAKANFGEIRMTGYNATLRTDFTIDEVNAELVGTMLLEQADGTFVYVHRYDHCSHIRFPKYWGEAFHMTGKGARSDKTYKAVSRLLQRLGSLVGLQADQHGWLL
jgi:hypothetical protein